MNITTMNFSTVSERKFIFRCNKIKNKMKIQLIQKKVLEDIQLEILFSVYANNFISDNNQTPYDNDICIFRIHLISYSAIV